jgi:hypothetical protein
VKKVAPLGKSEVLRAALASKPFEFTPDQRTLMCEAMGVVAVDDWAWLEMIAGQWRAGARKESAPPKAIRQRLGKTAKSLLQQLNSLGESTFRLEVCFNFLAAGSNGLEGWRQRLDELESGLAAVIRFTEEHPKPRIPANADPCRDIAWSAAALLYEGTTGKPMGAVELYDRGMRRLPPNSPFVRFLKAFTIACGKPEPSGDSICGWVRAVRKKRGLRQPLGRPSRRNGKASAI